MKVKRYNILTGQIEETEVSDPSPLKGEKKGMDTVFTCLGASNHTDLERADNDYYATDPKAVEMLLDKEHFDDTIWEPCVGGGHLAEAMKKRGYNVIASDLVDRGYPGTKVLNFVTPALDQVELYKEMTSDFNGDIITNPPYNLIDEIVESAMNALKWGHKLALLCRIQLLEGVGRRKLLEKYPLRKIYVPSKRIICARNAEFEKYDGSAMCLCWFIWVKGYDGDATVKWLDDLEE